MPEIAIPRSLAVTPHFEPGLTVLVLPETPAAALPLRVIMNGQVLAHHDYHVDGKTITIEGNYPSDTFEVDYFLVGQSPSNEDLVNLLKTLRLSGGMCNPQVINPIAQSTPLFTAQLRDFLQSLESPVPINTGTSPINNPCGAIQRIDFNKTTTLPGMMPLVRGRADNPVEAELKRITLDLWCRYFALKTFDVTVAGAAHLGSFDSVAKRLSVDGLSLAKRSQEESALRYLYRAWLGRNMQGRGLFFLKTFLQLQFGNAAKCAQLWQKKNAPYPEDLSETPSDDRFLTSRILVEIDPDAAADDIRGDLARYLYRTRSILESVLPARFVIEMRLKSAINQGHPSKFYFAACFDATTTFFSTGYVYSSPAEKAQLSNIYMGSLFSLTTALESKGEIYTSERITTLANLAVAACYTSANIFNTRGVIKEL